jgi:hypothetical protein
MDCFVAALLAMTVLRLYPALLLASAALTSAR